MMTLNILMIIAIFMAMALSMSVIAFASDDPVGTDLSGTDNYSYDTVYETDDETAWTMIVYSGEFGAVNQEDDIWPLHGDGTFVLSGNCDMHRA